MKLIHGKTLVAAEELDSHTHICDLLNVDFPVLSLYSDGRNNWLYLWADTDNESRERWLVFKINRDALSNFLKQKTSLRTLIEQSKNLYLKEIRASEIEEDTSRREPPRPKRYLKQVTTEAVTDYLPDPKSFFDPALTNDLDLARQIAPEDYKVPIAGEWFESDFEHLFMRYRRLYAFFYATRPRFVKTVVHKLREALRAPWRGGSSRLHMYTRLARDLPAIHGLRVSELRYASPGFVNFEALPEIGKRIEKTTLLLIQNEGPVIDSTKAIKKILGREKLNKLDLSNTPNSALPLEQEAKSTLRANCTTIGAILNVEEEFTELEQNSPNLVVFSKAVVSVVRQLSMLASLQRQDMLRFGD